MPISPTVLDFDQATNRSKASISLSRPTSPGALTPEPGLKGFVAGSLRPEITVYNDL